MDTYLSDNKCEQLSVCNRCGHKEEQVTHHFTEGTCGQVRKCSRCDLEQGVNEHKFVPVSETQETDVEVAGMNVSILTKIFCAKWQENFIAPAQSSIFRWLEGILNKIQLIDKMGVQGVLNPLPAGGNYTSLLLQCSILTYIHIINNLFGSGYAGLGIGTINVRFVVKQREWRNLLANRIWLPHSLFSN